MSITDSISSLGSSITDTVGGFVHDVGTRAPDVLHAATGFGHDVAKEAADLGRQGLETVGLIEAPKKRNWLPILLSLGFVIAVGMAVTRAVRHRRAKESGRAPEAGGVAGSQPLRAAVA